MNTSIIIRRAGIEDAGHIFDLINHFSKAGPCIMVPRPKEEIIRDINMFFVCEVKGKIAGCGRIKLLASINNSSVINSFCITEEHQRKGLGSELLKKLINKSKTRRIFVETTDPITKLFTCNGFRIIGPMADIFYGKIASDYKKEMEKYSQLCDRFPHNCPGILLELKK